jgi:hypothetical protein
MHVDIPFAARLSVSLAEDSASRPGSRSMMTRVLMRETMGNPA